MKRLWPTSLVGQLVALMLLALALAQGSSLVIYRVERAQALRSVIRDEFLGRTAAVVRLVQATPVPAREEAIEAAGTALTRHWFTPQPPGDPVAWQGTAREHLLQLRSPTEEGPAAANLFRADPVLDRSSPESWHEMPPTASLLHRPARLLPLEAWNGYGLAVQLDDGRWLNSIYAKPDHLVATAPTPRYFASLLVAVVIFSALAVLVARRISRPLRHLAHAAERLGRGEEVALLAEDGADDIRATASAFNRMQLRLRRFVEDRTRMLAAIGHDLRTPITSLRLRAEFVEDAETREKLLATLAEMQAMTEAALAFARSEATAEATRVVDLHALLQSLCDDLADLGWQVTFAGGERTTCACRPEALRRALRNLIENAVRYGDRAEVALVREADGLVITIADEGPGIPDAEQDRVFEPFVRLETSRNRDTGGVGLGLAIARSIVRGHGGDITLANLAPRGLAATVRLPCE